MKLDKVKDDAWRTMMATTRSQRVALQVGYLIDKADSLRDVLLALAMIGEFEIEEEAAAEEALVNALPGR